MTFSQLLALEIAFARPQIETDLRADPGSAAHSW